MVGDLAAEPFHPAGDQRRRAAEDDPRAELESGPRCSTGPRGEWPMSPTRPTVSPSIRPLARRIVRMSSRPCVGCSCAPSPALMIEALEVLRQQVRGAGRGVADDHDVDPHRLDVLGRVDERLALGQARDAGGEVQRVGREPLGRQAEAGPRPGRVLEEQVEDDPARAARGPSCGSGSRPRRTTRPCRGCRRSPRATGPPARAGACGSRPPAGPMRASGVPRPWSRRGAPPGLAYPSPSRRRPAPAIGPMRRRSARSRPPGRPAGPGP